MKCKNCLGSGYLWATIPAKYGSGPVYAPVAQRHKLTITVVSRDPKLLEPRAVSAVNHYSASRDCGTGSLLMDGGGWSWEWELGDELDAGSKAGSRAETATDNRERDNIIALQEREILRLKRELEQERYKHQDAPIFHLRLNEGEMFRCGLPFSKHEMSTFNSVNCVRCLKHRLLELVDSLNEAERLVGDAAEARGAKRNDVIKAAQRYASAVQRHVGAMMGGGPKMARKRLRQLNEARERLVDVACGGAQEGEEVRGE